MLDPELIRSHPDIVQAAAEVKGIDVDVHRAVELDRERRATVLALSEKRAERRRLSDGFREVSADVREKLRERSKALGAQIGDLEEDERRISAELDPLLLRLPNPPHESVPFGRTADENVPIRYWGEPRPANDLAFDHVQLMERLGMVDTARGVKLAGSRGYLLVGWGAVLEMALIRYAMDHITARGFLPLRTPSMVRELPLISTGQFPKARDQTYKIEGDESYLTGSADAPLTAFHAGEILDLESLPRLYSAISPCFRKEAGSAGRDVRGVFRVHEFQKVEQLVIARNDVGESIEWHGRIARYGEAFVQSLELPYRIVNAVTGDLGPAHVLMHDLECWVPSEGRYRENYSASFFGEWQARRANVRFRDRDGKVRFCHTLNNTVVASPRILIPFCEHHQEDGTLRIPPALHRYVGYTRLTGPWPHGEPVDAGHGCSRRSGGTPQP